MKSAPLFYIRKVAPVLGMPLTVYNKNMELTVSRDKDIITFSNDIVKNCFLLEFHL